MSGYRWDELTGAWVVVADARRNLPVDPSVAASAGANATTSTTAAGPRPCPFCPGHEAETEATVAQATDADGAWTVRVVRNRFPTVSPDAAAPSPAGDGAGFVAAPALGVHEVVVESRAHDADLPGMTEAHLVEVVRMYRDRQRALEAVPFVRAVSAFRNRGRRAGSSQSHPHAQLVATSVVPTAVERRRELAAAHHARAGDALLGAILARELAAGARVVEADEAFAVLCPFASHRAYETWIVPRARCPSFGATPDAWLAPLARALRRATRRVHVATRGAAYNLVVRTPAVGAAGEPGAWWHLEVLPRTGGDAGFELASSVDVVPVAPEDAARELRAVDPEREAG